MSPCIATPTDNNHNLKEPSSRQCLFRIFERILHMSIRLWAREEDFRHVNSVSRDIKCFVDWTNSRSEKIVFHARTLLFFVTGDRNKYLPCSSEKLSLRIKASTDKNINLVKEWQRMTEWKTGLKGYFRNLEERCINRPKEAVLAGFGKQGAVRGEKIEKFWCIIKISWLRATTWNLHFARICMCLYIRHSQSLQRKLPFVVTERP